VITPFLLLLLLIGTTPATAFFDGPVAHAAVGLAAAAAVGMVAVEMRPAEGSHLARVLRPWALPAAVPALWMAVQASPMPLADFAHPIWESAAAALDLPVVGAISIDPGITLSALGRYLCAVAIVFVATAVAVDRGRAEWMLIGLAGLTTIMAAVLGAAEVFRFAVPGSTQGVGVSLRALCALGVILSAAAAVYVVERFGIQPRRTGPAKATHAAALLVPILAFSVCAFAVARSSPQIVFATGCGVAVLALIGVARQLGVGPRFALGIAAAALCAALAVSLSGYGHGDPFVRFASAGRSAAADRMIEDSEVLGSGAGTFSALRPIYGTARDVGADTTPPTAAAAIVIELGRPMWVVLALIAFAGAAVLLRRALQRGRDWVYPAVGAGCIVLMSIEAFTDATLFNGAVATVAAAIIGLGLAQSVSRSNETTPEPDAPGEPN
jgi:hypothetical protein